MGNTISATTISSARCPASRRTFCSTPNGFSRNWTGPTPTATGRFIPSSVPVRIRAPRELTLKVKDRLPLHGHMEINDKSTPGTPLLRVDTAVQYNNLWQLEHQIGFDYNFSPQEISPTATFPQFYDAPMVASYSALLPPAAGFGHEPAEEYDRLPVDFGYDEVTHKFNLPPASGHPDLIFYASRFHVGHADALPARSRHFHQYAGRRSVRNPSNAIPPTMTTSAHETHFAAPGICRRPVRRCLFGLDIKYLRNTDLTAPTSPPSGFTRLTQFGNPIW